MKYLCLIFFLVLTDIAKSQSVNKTVINFTCTCNDVIGSRLATSVRDKIAKSPRYISKADYELQKTGKAKGLIWALHVVSMDPSRSDTNLSGISTIYSFVITLGSIYANSGVATCGSTRVDECAEDLIADIDKEISSP